ncbi:MAG TPA: PQQ-binding-like beta-propeller repeat protein [Gemmatimonadaceae bacterium]|nr:PQQ-binding-like beta-propeller repeat protein [Gemmatimonadaceae bacterium]
MRSVLIAIVAVAFGGISCSEAAPAGASHDSTQPPNGQPPSGSSSHDWTRFGWDAARSNASTDPTGIDSTNVKTLKRQEVLLDGTIDASPIYLHGVQVNGAAHDVFVVTSTYGKTYAIDANDGSILWKFTPDGYNGVAGSNLVTTATPVADPDRQSVYAASPDGNIRKLALADGRVVWTTSITKRPDREKIASALNFDRGHVIATTGGYIGDAPPYQGHVALIDAATGNLVSVWNALCSDRTGLIDPSSCPESDAAIWGRAGAVVDPATGDIFVATGNAKWDGQTYWGDAVIELDPTATHIVGNYTPSNTDQLNAGDVDVGSTSPVLLGNGVVAQGGKDGTIRVLGADAVRQSGSHRGGEAQTVPTPSSSALFTAPAVWHAPSGTTWMFAGDGGGTAAWTVSGGQLHQAWKNSNRGTSPVLAGGLLYVFDANGGLRVYQPESGVLVTTLECGGGHWNSPIIVDGMIAIPDGNSNSHATGGTLNIFRLP